MQGEEELVPGTISAPNVRSPRAQPSPGQPQPGRKGLGVKQEPTVSAIRPYRRRADRAIPFPLPPPRGPLRLKFYT